MNPKKNKIIFITATVLFSAIIAMSIGMYFFNSELIAQSFLELGYPAYLVYPLGIAKLLGLIAIWTNKSVMLREWAYAGFFFTIVLAFFAHIAVKDGGFVTAAFALLVVLVSYIYHKKLQVNNL